MAEQKRDYYEVLGVERGADDATIKKATGRLRSNSKRLLKHMQCLVILTKGVSMINLDILPSKAAEQEALVDLTSAELISLISSAISLAISLEAAVGVREATGR